MTCGQVNSSVRISPVRRKAGLLHDHDPDPAEPAVPRLDRGERKCGGDGSIDCGPARRQYIGADRRGSRVLGGDDPAAR